MLRVARRLFTTARGSKAHYCGSREWRVAEQNGAGSCRSGRWPFASGVSFCIVQAPHQLFNFANSPSSFVVDVQRAVEVSASRLPLLRVQ